MASVSIIVVLITCMSACIDSTHAQRTDTEVEANLLFKPVTVGGLMSFQCQIWNMKEGYFVDIVRFYDGQIEKITSDKTYQVSSLQHRVFLANRVFSDRTHVYVLTLVEFAYGDQGEYSCRVEQLSREGTRTIATGNINIEIHSFPNGIYPICNSEPELPITLYVGNRLVLSCASEKGVPTAELTWSCTHPSVRILSRNTSTDEMVSSEVTLVSDLSFHGVVFTCRLSSPEFPNRERLCHIGPITIHGIGNVDIAQPVIPDAGRNHIVNQNTHGSSGCSSVCSSEDEYIVLYLTISTIGASVLCLLFLTTTIIFCHKYHSISLEATTPTRSTVPYSDGNDPVYVSLQRRQENDRNSICSTYMTVEDPNNPGSKVLMPQEVYEEFYRTLTIKRV